LPVQTFGSNTSDKLELPGTDSQAATDLLAERFPPQQNGSSPIVFDVDTGQVTNSKNQQAIEDSHQAIVKLPHVASATDPFSQQGASQIARTRGRRSSACCSTSAETSMTGDRARSLRRG
jgi:RND superfamily putative drug exporter